MRAWRSRTSVPLRLTISRFFRRRVNFSTTPAMAVWASTRRLRVNRQARLMVCLAETAPAISRPMEARLSRSVRTEAATEAARVLDRLGRRLEVTQATYSRIDRVDKVAPPGGATIGRRGNPDDPALKVGSHCALDSELRWG